MNWIRSLYRTAYIMLVSIGIFQFIDSNQIKSNDTSFVLFIHGLCLVFVIIGLIWQPKKNARFSALRGALIVCALIIFIAHLLMVMAPPAFVEMEPITMSMNEVIIYVLIPLGFVFDWLLFERKGSFREDYPFRWLLLPGIYVVISVVRGLMRPLVPGQSRFPFFFLDIDLIGMDSVLIYVLVLGIAVISIGYLVLLVDLILSRLQRQS